MSKVCVLGSINMDLVLKVKNMPKEGQTILSKSFEKIPGGKGANQALAARRSGADVCMISKIGKDDNGYFLVNQLKKDNINTECVFIEDLEPTGMAMIMVNEGGNNSIIVVSGANMTINYNDISKAEEFIKNSDIIISQFETPEDMTIEAFKIAKKYGKITLLNPAPAKNISEELLNLVDIIVPNETEAYELTGVQVNDLSTAKIAAEQFLDKGIEWVIITLGAKGAVVVSKEKAVVVPAYKVQAIDTTAAGDSFIGGLSSKLNVNGINFESIVDAVCFGNKVSSIAVQRKGAQPSIPYLKEVVQVYGEE